MRRRGETAGNARRGLGALRAGAVGLTGLVVLYRPAVSGAPPGVVRSAAFGLLLLAALACWLASETVGGCLRVRFGLPGALFIAFQGAGLISCALAEDRFAAAHHWWALATYGLSAFLVLQTAADAQVRRFYLACLVATAWSLAAFALLDRWAYMPALRAWLAAEPARFGAGAGVGQRLLPELAARLEANRACGSFVTSDQLGGFLVMGMLPLLGLAVAWKRQRGRAGSLLAAGGGLALMALALWLSGSRGGWGACAVGVVVFVLLAGRGTARTKAAGAAATCVALAIAFLVCWRQATSQNPPPALRSLASRAHYWRTSVEMVRQRPLFGIGPGAWPLWYAALMEPEFEETRAPHSLYLRLWAENGSVGLVLFFGLCAGVLLAAVKTPPAPRPSPWDARPTERALRAAGPAVAGVALAFDYAFVGTFAPPRYVTAVLESARWLPYAGMWALWTAAFAVAGVRVRAVEERSVACGLAAGLVAFLVDGAGEVVLYVPALGGTAAVLAALLLASREQPRVRELRTGPVLSATALAACVGVVLLWAGLVAARAARYGGAAARAGAMAVEGARPAAVAAAWSEACAALSYYDDPWRERAAWLIADARMGGGLDAARQATSAARRATRLSPLDGANWAALGQALELIGDLSAALDAHRRAVERQPTHPAAWHRYGLVAEACGLPEQGAAAFRRALELLPRQYHRRNRVLGPEAELRAFCTADGGPGAHGRLLDLALWLRVAAGGPAPPRGATERQKVLLLAADAPGGRRLAEGWDSMPPERRDRQLWSALAPRLWQWALEVRLKRLTAREGMQR